MENVIDVGARGQKMQFCTADKLQIQPEMWEGLVDDANAPKDYSTETSMAVAGMHAQDCGVCMLRTFNEVPCRHLRQYRLYRTLPGEWTFNEDESQTVCADLTIKGCRNN